MAIENQVYLGQTFLKVKPTDRSQLIEMSKKAAVELAKKYKSLITKEKLTDEEINKLITITNNLRDVSATANLDRYDYMGMDHFWTLASDKSGVYLITIPNKEKDILFMDRFKSISSIFKEYRSLDDITTNSTFVGKKLHSGYNAEAYILYDFNDMLLGISLDEDGTPIGPLLARKNGVKDIKYMDESIPELDDPEIIYNYVKALKNRGN